MNRNTQHAHSGRTGGMTRNNPHSHVAFLPNIGIGNFSLHDAGGLRVIPGQNYAVSVNAADINHEHDFNTSNVNINHEHSVTVNGSTSGVSVSLAGGGANFITLPPALLVTFYIRL